jgi:hypothetical protein
MVTLKKTKNSDVVFCFSNQSATEISFLLLLVNRKSLTAIKQYRTESTYVPTHQATAVGLSTGEFILILRLHQTYAIIGQLSHASALARGNVVWAVLPSYGKG